MKYIKWLIILLLATLFLFLFFKNVNFPQVIRIIQNINPVYPIAFLIGNFFYFLLRGYRWGLILRSYNVKIPLKTLYNFTAIGFFLNIISGRLGEAARGILIAREEKISKSFGFASVVIERMIDSLVMVLLFLVSLFFLKDSNFTFLIKLKQISFYLLPVIIFIFLLFYLINVKKVLSILEKLVIGICKMVPVRFREKVVSFILNFIKGLKLNLKFFDFVKLIISSVVVWSLLIPFYWFLMQGFNIQSDIPQSVAFFSIIAVSSSIPIPGGAGSLDAGSKFALLNLYGTTTDVAVAYTLLFHFLVLFFAIIAGLIAFSMQKLDFKLIRNLREKNEMS